MKKSLFASKVSRFILAHLCRFKIQQFIWKLITVQKKTLMNHSDKALNIGNMWCRHVLKFVAEEKEFLENVHDMSTTCNN